MQNRDKDKDKEWLEKIAIAGASLVINAAVTYGVVSTKLEWIRADIDRVQHQVDRIEGHLFGANKPTTDQKIINLHAPYYAWRM